MTPETAAPSLVVAEAMDTSHVQASAAGITLEADSRPLPAAVAFDPARVPKVLANLLGNAITFTPPGGRVVVRLERKGDELAFSVIDTGIGIAENKLEGIFERFLQVDATNRRGLGLGLCISKCIVEGHGRRIRAESRLGEDTRFDATGRRTPPCQNSPCLRCGKGESSRSPR